MAGFKPFTPRPAGPRPGNQPLRGRRPEKETPHRINEEITADTVRIVGDNVEPNLVVPISKALQLADEMELDLVEISPNAQPPVCRIVDYQKFLYQQKKKQKEIRNRMVAQQRERDKLNREIERIIEEELQAQETEQWKQRSKGEEPATAKGDKTMPAYKERAADRKLSGSFESNKGKLPVPITGPYLLTSRYGVNYVEGLKNVKFNNHGGDVRGQEGCSARAIFDGTVSFVFEHPQVPGSFIVMVRHGQYISAYFNLTALKVKKGDKVKINEPLGLVITDVAGNCTMQFQLRKDKQSMNPELWVAF